MTKTENNPLEILSTTILFVCCLFVLILLGGLYPARGSPLGLSRPCPIKYIVVTHLASRLLYSTSSTRRAALVPKRTSSTSKDEFAHS